MSRQLSNELMAQLLGQDSNDPFLVLLKLSHPDFVSDVFLVNNSEDITSRAQVYTAFPFKLTLPPDDGETQRNVQLDIVNIGLELIDDIRSVTSPIQTTIEMILASDPDTVQMVIEDLKIVNIAYTVDSIRATLILDDFLNTQLVSEIYGPQEYPGLFD